MTSVDTRLSIIVPTLNEALTIGAQLASLVDFRRRGVEIVLVDGGSSDETERIAHSYSDKVILAPRGRASQMNAGAAKANGEVLLFLHADTLLPKNADALIEKAFARSPQVWGRFDVCIVPKSPLLTVVAWMMNWRSRLSGIATGDQAMFVRRSAFESVGGFTDIPLMEDIALSKALKRLSTPICLRDKVTTLARRWLRHGVVRTILLMWSLRLAYFFGADTYRLAKRYGYAPRTP
ncbi:MAG: TIGR04283 family arsenosugar biosynthesis glycosyltransferase [Alphaproteobacteria bacterium]|nr:TIGR04283 family arsenosugar biosynthesis glycosyltransferase [Alphaproteobacteria bacterium]